MAETDESKVVDAKTLPQETAQNAAAAARNSSNWKAVAFAFFATASVAALLVTFQFQARTAEVRALYAQTAARLGRAIEIRYDSNREVVDSVTSVVRLAQGTAATLLKADHADAKLVLNQELDAKAKDLQKQLEEVKGAKSKATQKEKDEWTRVFDALDRCMSGLPASTDALNALTEAARQEKTARQELELARTLMAASQAQANEDARAPGPSGPASTVGPRAPAPPAANSDVSQQGPQRTIPDLEARLAEATNELATRKAAADSADAKLKTACEDAGNAKPAVAASEATDDAKRKEEQAASAAAKARRQLEEATVEIATQAKELRSSSRLLSLGLKKHLPPSYRQDVEICAKGGGDLELCVARQIGRINNWNGRLTSCPKVDGHGIVIPTLTPDRRFVHIPSSSAGEHSLCAEVPLDQLLSLDAGAQGKKSLESSGARFDAVVLLAKDGSVLQDVDVEPGSQLRVAKFPNFKADSGDASSMLEHQKLGADEYRVFLQPVAVALSKGDAACAKDTTCVSGHDIVIAGLVREARLSGEASQISLTSYLWFVLLLAFGLLSLPLAKLWFLGTRSSFGRFDVTLLGASAVLIVLLTVVLTLGFVAHNRLTERLNQQMQQASLQLSREVGEKITARVGQLQEFLKQDKPRSCTAEQIAPMQFTGDLEPSEVCEYAKLGELGATRVFIADEAGRQIVKFTGREHVSTPLMIDWRDYFKRAKRGEPLCLGQPCALGAVPEVVRSATSGKFVLVIAQRYQAPTESTDNLRQRGVVAASEADLGIDRLVLPAGLQAAVIDDRGSVMLHSDNEARFRQPIFDDVDDADALRAAVEGESLDPIPLNLSYLGLPSRMLVRPLSLGGPRWYSVVIAPRSTVDMAALNMGITTLAGYGQILVLVLVSAFVVLIATQTLPSLLRKAANPKLAEHAAAHHAHSPALSLRPNVRFQRAYGRIAVSAFIGNSLLAVGAVACYHCSLVWLVLSLLGGGWALLWFPGVGVYGPLAPQRRALARWLRKRRLGRRLLPLRGGPTAIGPSKLRVGYPLAVLGLVGFLVGGPTAALFAGAYDYVAEELVRCEQHRYVADLQAQQRCQAGVTGDCEHVLAIGETAEAILAKNAGSVSNTPGGKAEPALTGREMALAAVSALNIVPTLVSNVPFVGRHTHEELSKLFGFVRRGSVVVLKGESHDKLAEAEVPSLLSLEYNPWRLARTLLAFAAFLGLGWVASACTLRRLFFLGPLSKQKVTAPITAAELLNGQRRLSLLIHPTPVLRQALTSAPYIRDFVNVGDDELTKPQPPGQNWIVPNLEELLTDVALARRIGVAARAGHRVLLLCEVEPLRRVAPAYLDQWTSTLQSFEEVEGARPSKGEGVRPTQAAMTLWWRRCDEDERRVLAQLALDGYTNPHPANVPALRHLVGRGLLRADKLTISSRAFKDFVSHQTTQADTQSWEDAGKGSVWQAIRVPLSTGVAALLTALAASKPELGVASALVPMATVGLPSLLRIVAATVAKPG